ncbi:hypothetical protein GYMLUDRAFT_146041, partial [Collybiopsis luxurians FD-317 M1]
SPKSLKRTQEAFENMLSAASQGQGVHPKLGQILKRTFDQVEKVGGDIGKEKRRQTMPR